MLIKPQILYSSCTHDHTVTVNLGRLSLFVVVGITFESAVFLVLEAHVIHIIDGLVHRVQCVKVVSDLLFCISFHRVNLILSTVCNIHYVLFDLSITNNFLSVYMT